MALRALREGHTVTVCLQDTFLASPEMADFFQNGGMAIPIKPLNWIQRRLVPKGLYSRFRGLRKIAPDVICLSGPPAEPFRQKDLCAFLESAKAPKIYILQGNDGVFVGGSEERKYLKTFYSRLNRLICVSNENAVLLQRQLTAKLSNILILPNPIRTHLEHPLAWPAERKECFKFATVGRYEVWSKGQDITMEALSSPEWKNRNWEWQLYGCGPDREYLEDLIRYYGLEGKVKIMGFERDFRKIWADNHLHVLCSRGEGLALALIESMYCGRPALVTYTGGNHELVRDGVDGFLCMGNNPEMIRLTLNRAWDARQNLPDMGASSFERVRSWVPADLDAKLLSAVKNACL